MTLSLADCKVGAADKDSAKNQGNPLLKYKKTGRVAFGFSFD